VCVFVCVLCVCVYARAAPSPAVPERPRAVRPSPQARVLDVHPHGVGLPAACPLTRAGPRTPRALPHAGRCAAALRNLLGGLEPDRDPRASVLLLSPPCVRPPPLSPVRPSSSSLPRASVLLLSPPCVRPPPLSPGAQRRGFVRGAQLEAFRQLFDAIYEIFPCPVRPASRAPRTNRTRISPRPRTNRTRISPRPRTNRTRTPLPTAAPAPRRAAPRSGAEAGAPGLAPARGGVTKPSPQMRWAGPNKTKQNLIIAYDEHFQCIACDEHF
jgi:hypothetical protein